LAILVRALAQAEAGKGGVVLVAGEPGIGKTRFLDELCARAQGHSFRVVRIAYASGRQAGDDLIRQIAAAVAPDEIDGRCLSGGSALSAGLEQVSASHQDLGLRDDGSQRAGPATESWFHGLLRLLERASREQPLLLALDDVDGASESALALIRLANASFRAMRILLLAACSQYGSGLNGQVGSAVASVTGFCRRINLNGLSLAMTGELVSQAFGNALSNGIDHALIRHLHELTGGNPSLILQAAASCIAPGGSWSGLFPDRIPEAIRVQIADLLAVLSPETREVLRFASVIGKTFMTQLLLGLVPCGRERGMAALSEAEDAGVLRPAGANAYQFAKGFFRWVLYAEFSSTQKADLHRRIAAALEAVAQGGGGTDPAGLALHLLASRDRGSIRRALEIAQAGGIAAARALDWQGAVTLYSIALEALDQAECADEAGRCDLSLALAEAQKHAGDFEGAQESLYDAAGIAERLADWSRLAEVVIAAPALNWPFHGQPNALVTGLAERVLALLPEPDSRRRALVTARWAAELSHLGEERKHSEQLSARALDLLKELSGDERSKLELLQLRDWVVRRPESISERLANAEQISAIARRLGHWSALFEGEWARSVCLFQSDPTRLDPALATLEHAARLAGPGYECYGVALRAIQSIFCGRFAEGERLFANCREMAAASGIKGLADQLWPAMMIPLYEQARLAELEPVVERWPRTAAMPTVVRCWMASRLGRVSEARFHLEWLAANGFAILKDSGTLLAAAATLADVCTELGDVPHHAETLYQLLIPYDNRNAVHGAFVTFGAVARYLGKLALLLSEFDEAVGYLQRAVAFNNRIGGRP
jgi:hypothetical protein